MSSRQGIDAFGEGIDAFPRTDRCVPANGPMRSAKERAPYFPESMPL